MTKYLIVGLGNPGEKYAQTRHNIGFEVLDALAGGSGLSFSGERYADRAEMPLKNKRLILIKPNTFMNLSGKAVNYWLIKEKINPQNLLVVVDDVALALGVLRLKLKGSDGGHNGLKSINQVLGNQKYPRLRFGIGNDYPRGHQVDYVLGEWSAEEWGPLKLAVKRAAEAVKTYCLAGPTAAMNQFNG